MMGKEFDKIFLEMDGIYKLEGGIFGEEWNEVRRQQIGFLLERPLMFKVLTEKFWGPQGLINLWTDEWWEAEKEDRKMNKDQEIEELADMTLLYLTLDSLNPNLLLPTQRELLRMGWDETVRGYCEGIGIDRKDLISPAVKKIKINELRNPREAFVLVTNEDIHSSQQRMDYNWSMLKKNRSKMSGRTNRQDWWKKSLYIDEGGWVREK